ncbi:MAG: glycosyltransferase [Deferribacteres bacterium]|nr:glycosyltransferase [Deferribacteres bacterium]
MAQELSIRGYNISYLAQSLSGKDKSVQVIERIAIYWLPYRIKFPWLNFFAIFNSIKHINPDILIQRISNADTGVIGYYASKNAIPFVWFCTDNESPFRWLHIRKIFSGFSKKTRPRRIASLLYLPNATLIDLLRHYGMKYVSHAFVLNEIQKKHLKDEFGKESSLLRSGHQRASISLNSTKKFANKIVLWAGNLGENKHPEKFIQLANQLSNSSYRFVLLGDKPGYIPVKDQLSKMDCNVEWKGKIPFEENLKWFDDAQFFVNTSEKEGFPNTYIQAWLRGIPVLTLSCDPDSLIKKHNLGFVCYSIDTMSDLLLSFTDEKEYQNQCQEIQIFAEQNFTIEKTATNFLKQFGEDTN